MDETSGNSTYGPVATTYASLLRSNPALNSKASPVGRLCGVSIYGFPEFYTYLVLYNNSGFYTLGASNIPVVLSPLINES
jgi:hypothetical protein